jgi:hypothetical protein
MPVETSSLFAQVIQDHLELKQKNSELEGDLPIDKYKTQDPFENHPLFKTEEQARREELETGEHPVLELPQETLEIPALPADEDVQHAKPRGWMETTASQEFSWE